MGPPLSEGHMETFIESKLIGIWFKYARYWICSIYQYIRSIAISIYDLIWIMNIVNCAQHDLGIDNYCDLFYLSLLMI